MWLCRAYLDLDPDGCALAEQQRHAMGVGFAHRRGPVASIGPLAARPGARAAWAARSWRTSTASRGARACGSSRTASIRTRSGSTRASATGRRRRALSRGRAAAAAHGRRARCGRAAVRRAPLEAYDLSRTGADRGRDLALSARRAAFVVERGEPRSPAISSTGSLPARIIVGPAVAESAELLATLVDAVAAALAGRPGGDPRLGRGARGPRARVRARLPRRPPRQPHGHGPVRAAAGAALRAVPREPLTRRSASGLRGAGSGLDAALRRADGPRAGFGDGRSLRSLSDGIRARRRKRRGRWRLRSMHDVRAHVRRVAQRLDRRR